jgi:hypothetical protein
MSRDTGRNQVVDNHDSIRGGQSPFLHFKDICSVFFDVFRLDGLSRELSPFPDGDKADVQTERESGCKDESTSVKPDDDCGLERTKMGFKDIKLASGKRDKGKPAS